MDYYPGIIVNSAGVTCSTTFIIYPGNIITVQSVLLLMITEEMISILQRDIQNEDTSSKCPALTRLPVY